MYDDDVEQLNASSIAAYKRARARAERETQPASVCPTAAQWGCCDGSGTAK